jgi:hypothetical protein
MKYEHIFNINVKYKYRFKIYSFEVGIFQVGIFIGDYMSLKCL